MPVTEAEGGRTLDASNGSFPVVDAGIRKEIGPGMPVYVIAEVSANHNQDFDQALEIIKAARDAGCDAVKLQTYAADTLTLNSRDAVFRISKGSLWEDRFLYELYQEAFTPWDWQPRLKEFANHLGLHCFSTPFDFSSVDFRESIGVPAYKIASFELVDLPLMRRCASTGKPLIISTGMATLAEIEEAVSAARGSGARDVVLLRTSSAYPAPPETMNLVTIPQLAATFRAPVGLSDHALGTAVPAAAVAIGACAIEKHITLSRSEPGPDSAFSLEPEEFKEMVKAIRTVERAVGSVSYGPSDAERPNLRLRRSLLATARIAAGEVLTDRNVRSVRPAAGLHTPRGGSRTSWTGRNPLGNAPGLGSH